MDEQSSPPPLSVVIITHNAAPYLRACLESVAFASERLVLDCGSTDGTVALAESSGARAVHQDWLGFGKQKQFAVEAARHDWVLCLDADERVSSELAASIVAFLSKPHAWACCFARCNYFLGRYLRHGEGYPDWSLRLFHRAHARWSDDAVHEKVLTEATVVRLPGDLLHHSVESLQTYLNKQNRYSSLAAQAAYERGERTSGLKAIVSPLVRFIRFYFFRLGFLDGFPGFVHICIGCFNSFSKYVKMREFQKRQDTQSL